MVLAGDIGVGTEDLRWVKARFADTPVIYAPGNHEFYHHDTHDEVIQVTKDLVMMLDDATDIVDFFKKQDEIKRVKKQIKRRILDTSFDDADLRKVVMGRFQWLSLKN